MQRTEEIASKALNAVDNDRYKLALLVAKRAEALASGDTALVKLDNTKIKFTDIALREIAEGKITLEGLVEPNK